MQPVDRRTLPIDVQTSTGDIRAATATVVRAGRRLSAGAQRVAMRFDDDGGPPGSGADITLSIGDEPVGVGRLAATTAFYFSFDETFNVGVDRATPVVADYPPLDNRFNGSIRAVPFDLAPDEPLETPIGRVTALRQFD